VAPSRQSRQLEQALHPQALAFAGRLRQLAIPVQLDDYGPGTHDWPYWQQALHRSLPLLRRTLGSG
jgi:diacylglycerol O-acyltransferase / trehalose O-mycolyltransferase